ncbi:hypothetical protein V2W45_1214894, partial [Cenococcum geophilum]
SKHHKTKHLRPFKCSVPGCDQKAFGLKRDLQRHQQSRHQELYPALFFIRCPVPDCLQADKNFRHDNLLRHIRTLHPSYSF